ncbi:MAG: anaerobic ribonucleoside-triphosphate reductase [Eubacteriales bacterium]|nr:anaerobic ribonucleoside-triphosphate reductase [Eubacteriales bacterium]
MEKTMMQEQLIGEGVGFERIRRITGYLVGTLDRFNNAKRAEVQDRVKHDTMCCSLTEEHTA